MKNVRTQALFGLGTVASLVLFGVVFQESRGPDQKAHSEVIAALGSIDTLATGLERQVLETSMGLMPHYDALVTSSEALSRTVQRLSLRIEAADARTPEVAVALDRLGAVLARRQQLLESFKRESAVLKNSLRYLPMAGRQLAKAAGQQWPGAVDLVDTVVGATLVHNLLHEPQLLQAQRAAVARLDAAIPKAPEAFREQAQLLSLHAKRAAGHHEIVVPILAGILDGALARQIGLVRERYGQEQTAANAYAEGWRWVLYGLSIVLLLGFVWAVRRLVLLFRTLEDKVASRTQALAESNRTMGLVLDNVQQGLTLLDRDGRIVGEPSAAMRLWFDARPGDLWTDSLRATGGEEAEFFELAWEMVSEGFMPMDVCLAQFPSSLEFDGAELSFEYRLVGSPDSMEGRAFEAMLVIATDNTEANARARAEQRERELLVLFMHLLEDVAGFREFREEADTLLERLIVGASAVDEKRWLHTLKGNFAVFGLVALSEWIHGLETLLEEEQRQAFPEELAALHGQWTALIDDVTPALRVDDNHSRVSREDIEALVSAIASNESHNALSEMVRGWSFDHADLRLQRLAAQAERIASTLDREVTINVHDGGVKLAPDAFVHVWSAAIHLLRNALDHGIEPRAERRDMGKPDMGCLTLATYRHGDDLVMVVADDGRGIDWDKVADRVRADGGVADSPEALQAALLKDGMSTRDGVSSMSGRGVGMGALNQAVTDEGGRIEISSDRGRGTEVSLRFPGAAADGRAIGPPRKKRASYVLNPTAKTRLKTVPARIVRKHLADELTASHPLLRAANFKGR